MNKRISITHYFILAMFLALTPLSAFCQEQQPWEAFIAELRAQSLADGIRPEVFDQAFLHIHAPNVHVLHLNKTQPEKRLSFLEYRHSRIDPYRIKLGRQEFVQRFNVLNTISSQYGVSPCVIMSIWGLETSYGRYKGNFPVIQSLATLTYRSNRSDFFRRELRMALQMLNYDQVKLQDFKGEWAGASGHCQFMPSTWAQYAVTYQGQGRGDIWNNVNDALASIANFLTKNGWHEYEPWAIEVTLPANFSSDLLNIKITKTVREWSALGVRPLDGELPNEYLQASLIYPDGGPALMVFNNFKTLLKWNRSNYYVGALGHLAKEICEAKA